MSASARLRQATVTAHERLEQTAFARAVLEGEVGRQEYVDYLRALAVVIATLCSELRRLGPAPPPQLLELGERWQALLAADLESLTTPTAPTNADATSAALTLASQMRLDAHRTLDDLLGIAYVLVGSHNGNLAVAPRIAQALGLAQGVGTGYLNATAGRRDWPKLKAFLDDELDDGDRIARATRAAESTFAGFERIMEALLPGAKLVHHPITMNPEAGDHMVTENPEVLDRAVSIAEQVHFHFPYLELRFGDRGRRFAHSDAAWLVGLLPLSPEVAAAQVAWLETLLSARGIPSICLETHLRLSHRAFTTEIPTLNEASIFGECADRIRARHDAVAGRARLDELAIENLAPLGEQASRLLASAVVDQHTGVAACADNIRAWLSEQSTLPVATAAAALEFLDKAAQRVSA